MVQQIIYYGWMVLEEMTSIKLQLMKSLRLLQFHSCAGLAPISEEVYLTPYSTVVYIGCLQSKQKRFTSVIHQRYREGSGWELRSFEK